MVSNLTGYHQMKIYGLNGAHLRMACCGFERGHVTVAQAKWEIRITSVMEYYWLTEHRVPDSLSFVTAIVAGTAWRESAKKECRQDFIEKFIRRTSTSNNGCRVRPTWQPSPGSARDSRQPSFL